MEIAESAGSPGGAPGGATGPEGSGDLARELTGSLPCVSCGYELRGLSVLATCPECGADVSRTIHALVDPLAARLAPLSRPRLTAIGLLLWAGAAAVAALMVWLQRASDLFGWRPLRYDVFEGFPEVVVGLVVASGVGALVLVRPHGGLGWRRLVSGGVGVLAYVPLVFGMWQIHGVLDPAGAVGYSSLGEPDLGRLMARLVCGGSMMLVLFGFRPNARTLQARSHLMRRGEVSRQTLLAVAAAVGVGVVGDLVRVVGMVQGWGELAQGAGVLLVAVGGALSTMGIVGAVVDVSHVAVRLMKRAVSAEELFGSGEGGSGSEGVVKGGSR